MIEKYLTLLDSKIEAEKQRFIEELVDGRCIDFAVYRELSGVIRVSRPLKLKCVTSCV